MTVAYPLTSSPDPRAIDHFVRLRGTFAEYKRLTALRGESSVPRITYLKGVLELMSPSTFHEKDRKRLARLLEA